MTTNVCPLGLCRLEEDCPHAPCLDCMRRLGEHMIDEVGVLERQANVARARGDLATTTRLWGLLEIVKLAIFNQQVPKGTT